jgi:hypothetical protein
LCHMGTLPQNCSDITKECFLCALCWQGIQLCVQSWEFQTLKIGHKHLWLEHIELEQQASI